MDTFLFECDIISQFLLKKNLAMESMFDRDIGPKFITRIPETRHAPLNDTYILLGTALIWQGSVYHVTQMAPKFSQTLGIVEYPGEVTYYISIVSSESSHWNELTNTGRTVLGHAVQHLANKSADLCLYFDCVTSKWHLCVVSYVW